MNIIFGRCMPKPVKISSRSYSSSPIGLRSVTFLLIAALTASAAVPVYAQPGHRPPPLPPPHHHHHNDLGKALGIIGAVGVAAAFANRYSAPYPYYHYYNPPVVVVPPRPAVVIEKPVVIERPVVIEQSIPVQTLSDDYFSPKLGATFRIEKMQIPGYRFTAARLTSDPVAGSPLYQLGLKKRDVITRLDDEAADSLDVLERHEKNTAVRYIKTGTVKVQLGKMYIPADTDFQSREDEQYHAP